MKTIKLRNIEIGTGIPKIIVPIINTCKNDIIAQAQSFVGEIFDVVEWRVDFYEDALKTNLVLDTLKKLRNILGDIPLIFTIRTKNEGGALDISKDDYTALNKAVADSGFVDAIDVEIFLGDDIVQKNIANIHQSNAIVIGSNHDFNATPNHAEIISRLIKMQDMGADIPKIAVMPQNKTDVLTLLLATTEMNAKYAKGPIITMSMAEMGAISRICGEVFGSSMTFGILGEASAPGQIPVKDMAIAMDIIHNASC